MRVRRKSKSGLFSRLRRLGLLVLLGAAGWWLWRELQGRRGGESTASYEPPGDVASRNGPSAESTTQGFASVATASPEDESGSQPTDDAGNEGRIKGNKASMLYHTVDSPNYKRTRAETWFDTEDEAQAAGYSRWDHKRAADSAD